MMGQGGTWKERALSVIHLCMERTHGAQEDETKPDTEFPALSFPSAFAPLSEFTASIL